MKLFFVVWVACSVGNIMDMGESSHSDTGGIMYMTSSRKEGSVRNATVDCVKHMGMFDSLDQAKSFAEQRKYGTDISSGTAEVYELTKVK